MSSRLILILVVDIAMMGMLSSNQNMQLAIVQQIQQHIKEGTGFSLPATRLDIDVQTGNESYESCTSRCPKENRSMFRNVHWGFCSLTSGDPGSEFDSCVPKW